LTHKFAVRNLLKPYKFSPRLGVKVCHAYNSRLMDKVEAKGKNKFPCQKKQIEITKIYEKY
jgi:hypothetical protein